MQLLAFRAVRVLLWICQQQLPRSQHKFLAHLAVLLDGEAHRLCKRPGTRRVKYVLQAQALLGSRIQAFIVGLSRHIDGVLLQSRMACFSSPWVEVQCLRRLEYKEVAGCSRAW